MKVVRWVVAAIGGGLIQTALEARGMEYAWLGGFACFVLILVVFHITERKV